jgi:hypothetical protein
MEADPTPIACANEENDYLNRKGDCQGGIGEGSHSLTDKDRIDDMYRAFMIIATARGRLIRMSRGKSRSFPKKSALCCGFILFPLPSDIGQNDYINMVSLQASTCFHLLHFF